MTRSHATPPADTIPSADAGSPAPLPDRDLRREFADREDLIAYVAALFPAAAARDRHVAPTRGGRAAAEATLAAVDPAAYALTRNTVTGRVTRLGPYLRYGVLSLAEVRDHAINAVRRRGDTSKLVQELAWRDYFARVYARIGDGIWDDREPLKTGHDARSYAAELPDDVRAGTTGLPCMDAFVRDLRETGYLHNHARLWLAAYLVHWRRVRWQAGAAWFLEHLLCGDPASNNLSWQWVASTFGHKPYVFNRENLEQYTEGAYCRTCPLYGRCDFEGTYDELSRRLFRLEPADATRRGREAPERRDRGRRDDRRPR
ncbi:MAG: Deoxyribodipyrimidine photolyase [uncultured Thermomicrobiales bacterium]|uniref:Deoxyribodipyrimidine photolyase n=1 Tax=uncultured Thermomicrobiales bacterium TaxID=1645740 RepID=A0A6J4V9F3_9BACT|nr:MAG: Deoxyribodipyrimidine photolyase [uncultured Thermomicrobiales bacterium]